MTPAMRARLLFLLLIGIVLIVPGAVTAHPYLNSSEPGCDGSDSNVLLCDDFETADANGGKWYSMPCDDAQNRPGGILQQTKGWCGKNPKGSTVSPAGAVRCGSVGAGGTNCAASSGVKSGGQGAVNWADHTLLNEQGVTTIYVRYYVRFLPGYQFGWEKFLTINRQGLNTAGIFFGHAKLRGAQTGGRPTSVSMDWEIANGFEDGHRAQNQGNNMQVTSTGGGPWFFMEWRLTLETSPSASNGILELWMNNCGTNGLGCTGTPTLRMRHTNVHFRLNPTSEPMGNVYLDFWGNQGSIGEFYFDQLKVSKVGPIGFMGGGTANPAPGMPVGLQVTTP